MSRAEGAEPLHEAAPRARRPRLARGVVDNELHQPLEAVARSLQRLSLQDVGDTGTAHLIRRARTLTTELLDIVADLVDATTPAPGPVMRAAQQRVAVRTLALDAADEVRARFDRAVDVRVTDAIAANTDPVRVRAILVNVLAAASRASTSGTIVVDATWKDRVLEVSVAWPSDGPGAAFGDGDPGLTLARTLARSLGGDLGVEVGPHEVRTSLGIPQFRTGDRR